MTQAATSRLLALWLRLTTQDRAHAARVCEDVAARYREPTRRYHTLEHIKHCLRQFDLAAALLPDRNALELGIWFHDVVYDPKAPDNEVRSAEFFRERAGSCMVPSLVEDVARLVLVTRYGELPRREDEAYMVDIDYSSFGLPWDACLADSLAVRAERPDLSDAQYALQHRPFLASLLARETLYRTDFFRARYEDVARSNIQRYLALLQRT